MPIKLNGATSGSVELDVPAAVGSDLQLTLPATAGDVVVKAADGSVDLGSVDIDSAGRLLVGTSSAQGVSIIQAVGSSTATTEPGDIRVIRGLNVSSIGSNVGAELGVIKFGALENSVCAQISAVCDANWSAGDYPGRLVFSTTADGASSPTERMKIDSIGAVNTLGDAQAAIFSTKQAASSGLNLIFGRYSATSPGGGSNCFLVRSNGQVENANGVYGSFSDIKLKENIVDASSQWDDIKALQVRKYNFKEETGHQTHTQIGVIAQEVELVSPGLVNESPDEETIEVPVLDADGNPILDDEGNPKVDFKEQDAGTVTKSVNYSVLYMKAVKALQEAMTRIETLEAKVTALEAAE